MELHRLKPASGSTGSRKRIARGQGSGRGGTSTRGHKGAKSRSGYKSKRNFEGGQMPLQMRLPKRGFNSPNRIEYVTFNVSRLEELAQLRGITEVSPEIFRAMGLIKKSDKVKILGNGDIAASLKVTAHSFSNTAAEKIKACGGSIEQL